MKQEQPKNAGPGEAARANRQTRINAKWAEAAIRTAKDYLSPMEIVGLIDLTLEDAFAFRAALSAHLTVHIQMLIQGLAGAQGKILLRSEIEDLAMQYVKGEIDATDLIWPKEAARQFVRVMAWPLIAKLITEVGGREPALLRQHEIDDLTEKYLNRELTIDEVIYAAQQTDKQPVGNFN